MDVHQPSDCSALTLNEVKRLFNITIVSNILAFIFRGQFNLCLRFKVRGQRCRQSMQKQTKLGF